ncbi:Ig-like domain-containing protein [uncultured Algibacter sp.]|uniref:Ig-like domain-containing protein n=1 Tax=uncultured Algibacter sp. TaxID=298659 RepID=UPI00321694BC
MKKIKHRIFELSLVFSMIFTMSNHFAFAQTPFTDPSNSGGWILNPDLSDEFEGGSIDETKFLLQGRNDEYRSNWIGRAPSQFSPDNARQENGSLKLQTRWEPDFAFSTKPQKDGAKYENITVSAVITRKQFLYGYMEIRAKSANISIQSSFWATGKGCELDVFENNGKPSLPNKEKLETELWSSIHDWSQAGGPSIWTGKKQMPFRFADDFHVYGCEWDPEYIKIFVDGELMRYVTKEELGDNWVMDQPIWIWLDNETFPWQGNPSEADLPADYEVQYLRIWQKELSTPGPVKSVKISNPTLKMQSGQKGFLTKEVFPFNATNQSVKWTSSNTAIARVSGGGVVTALKNGTAIITVQSIDGNKTDTCVVTITNPMTNNIVADSGFESGNLNAWEASKGNASVVSNNAHSGSKSVYFNGSGTAAQIIRVDPNTVYTLSGWAKTGGASQQVYIGANEHDGKNVALKFDSPSYEEKSGYFTTGANSYSSRVYAWNGNKNWKINADDITVSGSVSSTNPIRVSSIVLSRNTLTLRQRETEMVIPKVLPLNATDNSFTWTSSNTRVCTVTPIGEVFGKQVGTATITARTADGNKVASCVVTVNPLNYNPNPSPVSVTGVTVSPTSRIIAEGASATINANVLPSNATNKTVIWRSNNTSVATVNSSGVITAQSQGTAIITVRTSDGNKTATSNITVTASTTVGVPIGSTIWLKSYEDMYVTRASGNNLRATGNNLGTKEQFEIVDAGNGFIALKNIQNNKYVQVINTNGNPLRAGSSKIFNRQRYTWESQGANKVALKAKINNTYVRVDNSKAIKPLEAQSVSVGNWETFNWGLVNGTSRSVAKSENIKNKAQIQIYPNPFKNGNLNIELGEASDATITIFDITGKAVFTNKYINKLDIIIKDTDVRLSNGMYYIKVQSTNLSKIKKLIVQK